MRSVRRQPAILLITLFIYAVVGFAEPIKQLLLAYSAEVGGISQDPIIVVAKPGNVMPRERECVVVVCNAPQIDMALPSAQFGQVASVKILGGAVKNAVGAYVSGPPLAAREVRKIIGVGERPSRHKERDGRSDVVGYFQIYGWRRAAVFPSWGDQHDFASIVVRYPSRIGIANRQEGPLDGYDGGPTYIGLNNSYHHYDEGERGINYSCLSSALNPYVFYRALFLVFVSIGFILIEKSMPEGKNPPPPPLIIGWFFLVAGILAPALGVIFHPENTLAPYKYGASATCYGSAEDIRVGPVVVAPLEFGHVKWQVFFAEVVESPNNAALQQRGR